MKTVSRNEFALLREYLIEADGNCRSRKELAEKLHVSTHTIQNILNGDALPDFTLQEVSRRRRLAWARTVARIAYVLKKDLWELLESVGIVKEPEIESVVADELEKMEAQCSTDIRISSPVDLLARGLLLSISGSNSADSRLEKALREYIQLNHGQTSFRAGASQLADGAFCRSCMSSLDSDENRGNSEMLCRWCSDSEGKLLPRDRVLEIMTHWFSSWQPGISLKEAGRRADLYMRSMPAWAEAD